MSASSCQRGGGGGVKRMQKSGTEANRTQIQSSKPKREITNITNSPNTKENSNMVH